MDILGQRFGLLEVVGYAGFTYGKVGSYRETWKDHSWYCLCDCGTLCKKRQKSLCNGGTKSCGCLADKVRKEWIASRFRRGPFAKRLYNVWFKIKERCLDTEVKAYKDYGGRGITLCEEWMNFPVFYEWAITSGYEKGLTIERIDNDKGYSPENCKWILKGEQLLNTRRSRYFTLNGVTMNLSQWAKSIGILASSLAKRIDKLNWSIEEALTTPRGKKR